MRRGPHARPFEGNDPHCLAIDVHENPVAKVRGHRKPSPKRMEDALLSCLACESLIVHGTEKSHPVPIKAAKRAGLVHGAGVSDPPLHIEAMAMAYNLCSWLKWCLWQLTGMSPENLQSNLNWFVYLFMVSQAKGKWHETESAVRHLLQVEAHYRS